jgi:hypothetical protein
VVYDALLMGSVAALQRVGSSILSSAASLWSSVTGTTGHGHAMVFLRRRMLRTRTPGMASVGQEAAISQWPSIELVSSNGQVCACDGFRRHELRRTSEVMHV